MSTTLFFAIALVEAATLGSLFLLYPRFARRGLLFGVYVGEAASVGPDARAITGSWYRGMLAWLVAAVGAELALGFALPKPALIGFYPLVIVAGFAALYVRAYRQARRFAAPPAAPAVAIVRTVPDAPLRLPMAALVVGLAGGAISIAYSVICFPQLPDRIPTHFGITGTPDAWHAKNFATVLINALLALVVGAGLGGVALFTARAKRAVRYSPTGVGLEGARAAESETEISLHAQLRFRRAVTRLISSIALLMSIGLTLMNIGILRVSLGQARTLPAAVMALMLAVVVLALGGTAYIGLRYGQGGARLERRVATAPLTNGLADNRYWVLGAFYINRDDPSFMVEDRFGLGYTVNFGNRKAVLAFGGFLAAIVGLAIAAVVFL